MPILAIKFLSLLAQHLENISFKLGSGEHYLSITLLATYLDVSSQSGNLPLIAAARVRLSHPYDVA